MSVLRALVSAVAGVSLGVCACSEGNSGVVGKGGPDAVCVAEQTEPCRGAGDCEGEMTCLEHGLGYGACECASDTPSDGGAPGAGGMGSEPSAGSGAGGAGGDATVECSATCEVQEPAVCADGERVACLELQIGCPEPVTLACASGFCADALTCGVCPQQCDMVGEMACAKGRQRTCELDERGCRVWGEAESECASGFCAADGQGCGTCIHECPTLGATVCQAAEFRRCAEDAFGCRRWWYWAKCELGSCADATECASGYSQRQRGSPLDDEPLALTIDPLGRLVMAGAYHEFDVDQGGLHQETDAHLHVVTPDGSLKIFESWGDPLEADAAVAVAVSSDNSYVLVGHTAGAVGAAPSHGGIDAFLSKWSVEEPGKAPVLLYSRQWGGPGDDWAHAVALDADDTAFVIGSSEDDLLLLSWDSAGNALNNWEWGTGGVDEPASILVDGPDELFIAGTTDGEFPDETQRGEGDAFVTQLDRNASALWTTQFGTSGDERVTQMVFDRQGNLLVLGTTDGTFAGSNNAGLTDVFLTKLDRTGEIVFTRQWGTTAADTAAALVQAPDGRIFAAVTVADAEQGCEPGQALLLEWNAAATQTSTRLFDTCEEERATAITADPNNVIYLAGSTRGLFAGSAPSGGTDIFTIVSQLAP